MEADLSEVRRQYASLTDTALREIDRAELIEGAQKCLDDEFARRGLAKHAEPAAAARSIPKGDWRDRPGCVCIFESFPERDSAPRAEDARKVLEAAGIPSYVDARKVDPNGGYPRPDREYLVMVPLAMSPRARGVLHMQIYNEQEDAGWRAHFEDLSDGELRSIDVDGLVEGFLDYAKRLRGAYEDELARRNRIARRDAAP